MYGEAARTAREVRQGKRGQLSLLGECPKTQDRAVLTLPESTICRAGSVRQAELGADEDAQLPAAAEPSGGRRREAEFDLVAHLRGMLERRQRVLSPHVAG